MRAMADQDTANLIAKLVEMEEQARVAIDEVPKGLTASRLVHIRILARFVRMRLQGQPVADVEPMQERLRDPASPPSPRNPKP